MIANTLHNKKIFLIVDILELEVSDWPDACEGN